jgi:DNA-binding transcriptional ArsR family regulator
MAVISFALLGKLAKYPSMKATRKTRTLKAPADFRQASEVFKALSNPNRLLIVDALAKGERCVADLTALVGLDMSTVSNHLSVLRNVGILKDERRGTQVFYSLRKPCLLNVFCCLDEFHAEDDA